MGRTDEDDDYEESERGRGQEKYFKQTDEIIINDKTLPLFVFFFGGGVEQGCILNFKFIFLQFVHFLSIGGKICIFFTNCGKKYAFSPFFFIPCPIIFFPQHVIWPYFCQTEKYSPLGWGYEGVSILYNIN